jgi:hypothetical protein
MKPRSLQKNRQAVSMMYDAVLFIVMVSLSGVVLIPALQSDVIIESSVGKHREETVDETLLMLLTSRMDSFGYTLAGSQIEDLTNIDVDYDGSDQDLIQTLVKTFLGREQWHKTYADLCVENLVCQLNVFGTRINVFTEDFDESIREEVIKVLREHLSDKYEFNLTLKWHPIMGLDFGGDLEIGPKPPVMDTHVAETYVALPGTFFTEWLKDFEDYITQCIDDVLVWNNTDDGLKNQIKNLMKNIVENIILNGFMGNDGVLDKCIDYVFSPIENGIERIFGDSFALIVEPIETVIPYDLTDLLDGLFSDVIKHLTGLDVTDSDGDSVIDAGDSLDFLKTYVKDQVTGILDSLFDGYFESFASFIVNTMGTLLDIDQLKTDMIEFFKDHINVLRAEIMLTLWEVRG